MKRYKKLYNEQRGSGRADGRLAQEFVRVLGQHPDFITAAQAISKSLQEAFVQGGIDWYDYNQLRSALAKMI